MKVGRGWANLQLTKKLGEAACVMNNSVIAK